MRRLRFRFNDVGGGRQRGTYSSGEFEAKVAGGLVENCEEVEFDHFRRDRTIIWCTGLNDVVLL